MAPPNYSQLNQEAFVAGPDQQRDLQQQIEQLRLQLQQMEELKAQVEDLNRRLVALENKSKAGRWNKTGSGHFKIS